jgi:hypothetical protein
VSNSQGPGAQPFSRRCAHQLRIASVLSTSPVIYPVPAATHLTDRTPLTMRKRQDSNLQGPKANLFSKEAPDPAGSLPWCTWDGSNILPPVYQTGALPR